MLNYLKHALLLLPSLITFTVHASENEDLFSPTFSIILSPASILIQPDEEILSELNWKLYQKTENTLKAIKGDHHAQALLIDCYLHNRHGFITTPHNQKAILSLLQEFAKTNPMAQVQLVQAYIDGDFGIKPKKARQSKRGKSLALKYIDTPEVGDLIIFAMKENRLGFKSRRSYIHRYKNRKINKWVQVKRNPDLPVIKELAFRKNNKNAQTFLLECFIDNKYGADSLNKNAFRKVVHALEPFAYNNPELAELMILVWDQNLLAIKNRKTLNQKRLRIHTAFAPQYTGQKNRNENPFAILQDLNER